LIGKNPNLFFAQKSNFRAFSSSTSPKMVFGLLQSSFGLRHYNFGGIQKRYGLLQLHIRELKKVFKRIPTTFVGQEPFFRKMKMHYLKKNYQFFITFKPN
jgi:hypothetical protein